MTALLDEVFLNDLDAVQYDWFKAMIGRMLVHPDDRTDTWNCFPVIIDNSSSASAEKRPPTNTPSDLLRLVCDTFFPGALQVGAHLMPSTNNADDACSMFSLEAYDAARMAESSVWICANDFSSQQRHVNTMIDMVIGSTMLVESKWLVDGASVRDNDLLTCAGKLGIGWTRHSSDVLPLTRVTCVFQFQKRNSLDDAQWVELVHHELPKLATECARMYRHKNLLYGHNERAFVHALREADLVIVVNQ